MVDAYFLVKNNLVKDQLPTSSIQTLTQALLKVSADGTGKDNAKWEKIKTGLADATAKIKGSKDIASARTHFSSLSTQVIKLTETYKITKAVVYQYYCPMSFNNKGGYWLSETEDIQNPYFGASMLTCGEVKQTYLNSLPK